MSILLITLLLAGLTVVFLAVAKQADDCSFLEPLGAFFSLLFGIATIIAGCVATNNYYSERGCNQYHQVTGIETRYSFETSCLVKVDGKWMEYSRFEQNQSSPENRINGKIEIKETK